MTDAEFIEAVLSLDHPPVTELEERHYGVQCAEDYAKVWMARLDRLIYRYRQEKQ